MKNDKPKNLILGTIHFINYRQVTL